MAFSDEWVISGTLTEERSSMGYGSSESWGLVMAGGYLGSYQLLSSVETTANGITFGTLPDLEIEVESPCLVVIDDDKIFTCGGFITSVTGTEILSRDTYMFSKTTNSWSRYVLFKENYLLIKDK